MTYINLIGAAHPDYKEEELSSQRLLVDREANKNFASNSTEVRVTSSSGGQKGSKLARYDLIPTKPLHALAEHYGKGAEKYEKVNGVDNWRNGYEWSLSKAALQRHLEAFWGGEDIDEETGSLHIIAVAWHAFTLAYFLQHERYKEFDDRQDKIMDKRDSK